MVSAYKGYIHLECMSSRHSSEYVKALRSTMEFYEATGNSPNVQRMDNETSHALESYLKSKNVTIQYLSSGNHRASKAERAVGHPFPEESLHFNSQHMQSFISPRHLG